MLAAGDPQRCGHGLAVKSGVEHHDCAVNSTVEKVLGKLLDGEGGEEDKERLVFFQNMRFGG